MNSTGGCGATAWDGATDGEAVGDARGELVGLASLETVFKPGPRLIPTTATTTTAAAAIANLA